MISSMNIVISPAKFDLEWRSENNHPVASEFSLAFCKAADDFPEFSNPKRAYDHFGPNSF